MKNIKYIWMLALVVSLTACEEDDLSTFGEVEELPALTAGDADFSNYVALGASFTAGFTDNALFIASQENSFPNTLSKQFFCTLVANFRLGTVKCKPSDPT